jgi:FkbM family methyltransferase
VVAFQGYIMSSTSIRMRISKRREAFCWHVAKLQWGARTVGWVATVLGCLRLLRISLLRPPTVEVRLRNSGAVLGFTYPTQLVPALVVFGDLIDPEYAFLTTVAQPGWTFLDVGAAIGQFSVFAAFSKSARVHAFEPGSGNLATLRSNIARNGIGGRVTVHQIALSNRSGEAQFATASNPFMSRLDRTGPTAGERVAVYTLTNVVDRLGIDHVSVLKINVAGFEPEVIQGAIPILAQGRVDILILLIGRPSYNAYRELSSLGYRFFFFHPRSQRLHAISSLDDEGLIVNRPWPARHVLAIRAKAMNGILDGRVAIEPPIATAPRMS